MDDKLGTGLYSNATDAKSIVGLRQIVGSSNTVGGISQTSYSWWQAQVDSSTTTLTIAAMRANATIRRWRSRSSAARTRTTWQWRCEPTGTTNAATR